MHRHRYPHQRHDRTGKLVPGTVPRAGEVDHSAQVQTQHPCHGISQIARMCRTPTLVRHNAKLRLRVRELHHRFDEVLPMRAVHPGAPHHERVRTIGERAPLPFQLGPAVGVQRVGLVRLPVGRVLLPVKDVIGREVDEPGARLGRGSGHPFRSLGVDGHRNGRVSLRPVNIGIRRGMDHHLGLCLKGLLLRLHLEDIKPGPDTEQEGMVFQSTLKLMPELPVRPSN